MPITIKNKAIKYNSKNDNALIFDHVTCLCLVLSLRPYCVPAGIGDPYQITFILLGDILHHLLKVITLVSRNWTKSHIEVTVVMIF